MGGRGSTVREERERDVGDAIWGRPKTKHLGHYSAVEEEEGEERLGFLSWQKKRRGRRKKKAQDVNFSLCQPD